MTPDQITEYVIRLNNSIYTKLIKGDWHDKIRQGTED
jgi:hypothetical protein